MEPLGLSGIVNMGNTCYMNSALQCISNTQSLRDFFINGNFIDDLIYNLKKKGLLTDTDCSDNKKVIQVLNQTLTYQLFKLLKGLWYENCIVSPICFKNLFSNKLSQFFGYSQQDSEEAINCILNTCHNELSRSTKIDINNIPQKVIELINKKNEFEILMKQENLDDNEKNKIKKEFIDYKLNNLDSLTIYKSYKAFNNYYQKEYSIISNLFMGMLYSSLTCPNCKYRSDTFEPFNILQVEIPNEINGEINIHDCLNNFTKIEKLDDNNKWVCSNCTQSVNADKKIAIWDAPKYLIIQLKRFNFMKKSKIDKLIDFPQENLLIDNYISPLNYKQNNNSYYKYNLYATCNHVGNIYGGHYYSYCKNNNNWYNFNDEKVSEINGDKINKKQAYILFYKLSN
jgi:ubiquitin C-terminal hydrolase